ncbi:MAG: ATP-binding cassette domain-containing protein, partial [Cyclobacteriaceae bacterium]|nr:ATP-binding cassette domain-containing protein [Cyclobacteriaceae bacterium]
MRIVHLHSITHRYGDRAVLQNIEWALTDKKVTALLGKSGSGKSTLLKTINGLVRPAEGAVTLFEKPIDYNKITDVRRSIGYVVQGVGLFPHLTVEENISLPGRVYPGIVQQPAERVSELMSLVHLHERHRKKFPHQLSGGEQQRAGICRALFLNPPLLLMDEPFGSLDAITQFDIHREFMELQKAAPRAVILVTHDLREARKLADEVVVVDQGAIQQAGT